jgi:hypothetical protein
LTLATLHLKLLQPSRPRLSNQSATDHPSTRSSGKCERSAPEQGNRHRAGINQRLPGIRKTEYSPCPNSVRLKEPYLALLPSFSSPRMRVIRPYDGVFRSNPNRTCDSAKALLPFSFPCPPLSAIMVPREAPCRSYEREAGGCRAPDGFREVEMRWMLAGVQESGETGPKNAIMAGCARFPDFYGMKRRRTEQIMEQVEGRTIQGQLGYWCQGTEELKRHQGSQVR